MLFNSNSYYKIKKGDQQPEPIALADVLDRPQNLFAIGLAAILAEQPFANLPNPLIDGSGKAKGSNAWRIEFAEEEQASLFGWFRMYGESGLPEPQLVKLASDRDASKGGIVFDKWEQIENNWLPVQSRLVSGLAETTVMSIQIDSATMTSDEDLLKFPEAPTNAEPETPAEQNGEAKE